MSFTEHEYLKILNRYQPYFSDFESPSEEPKIRAYLRHDVEADLEKAEYLSRLNRKSGVVGYFMVQVVSEFYNIFSFENRERLRRISGNGQKIGLHYYSQWREKDPFQFEDFDFQANVLNRLLAEIDLPSFKAFSYHRPTRSQLKSSRSLASPDGYIDCYSPEYFTFTETPELAAVKYMSDSDHEWRYGHPLDIELSLHDTYQILMHPEEWPIESTDDVYKGIVDASIDKCRAALKIEYRKYKG